MAIVLNEYGIRKTEGGKLACDVAWIGEKNREDFISAMASEHRTLQQGFTRMCVNWLFHLASLNDGEYDLRNQASVELARKIVAEMGNDLHLPMV